MTAARKSFPKLFIVSHGTYPFDILISYGCSDEELSAKLKTLGIEVSDEEQEAIKTEQALAGRTAMLSGGQTVMRLPILKDRADFHGMVAHEVFHAVEFLFDRIALKHSLDAGEAFAYQIQLITKQIYEALPTRKL